MVYVIHPESNFEHFGGQFFWLALIAKIICLTGCCSLLVFSHAQRCRFLVTVTTSCRTLSTLQTAMSN